MIGTPSGLRQYANDRGLTPPEIGIDERANQALTRATDYIEAFYVPRFDSGLTVPLTVLEYATYEAAILELTKPGFFNANVVPGRQKEIVEAKGIRWELTNKGGALTPISERINALLAPYIRAPVGFYVI